ncbi:MAG: type II toxin-antitoxin system VapC family toxin [Planctomycetes bacterium]|nr:type II toxin-antitoxin system VapC family toxin [Planctomycetota bacterium]
MRLLLDTHTVIFAVDDPPKLGPHGAKALEDLGNELLLSAGTIWEIGIKVGLKKLSLSMPYREWMNKAIADLGITVLPITVEYADAQAGLPFHHRDPFDRLLAAQARVENVSLVSADAIFDQYGVNRIWQ